MTFWKAFATYDGFFRVTLELTKKATHAISDDVYLAWTFNAIFSNVLLLILLTALLCQLTRSATATAIGFLVFATSAWPATYYFMGSYAPFAAFLTFGTLFFLIQAVRQKSVSENREVLCIMTAGIFAAALFMSSASSLLTIGAFIPFIIFWFRNPWYKFLVFPATFFTVLFPFLIINGRRIFDHWEPNIFNGHKFDALQKFGYTPLPPFFSYFHILNTYSWGLLALFLLLTIFYLLKLRKQSKTISTNLTLWLLGIIFAQTLLIDILPFTKLARTQYDIYPIMILTLVVIGYEITISTWVASKHRRVMAVTISLLLVITIVQNVLFISTMHHARIGAVQMLTISFGKEPIYLLTDDPHAPALTIWLGENHVRAVDSPDQIPHKALFLVGPHGPDSGKSIMKHSTLDDFAFNEDKIKPRITEKKILPYYAYFPAFLLEEEVSQALYFSGKSPDPKLDRLQLTLYRLD